MGISKCCLIVFFIFAASNSLAQDEKHGQPCPIGHLVHRAPDNCEWIVANRSDPCHTPTLVCRGNMTTPVPTPVPQQHENTTILAIVDSTDETAIEISSLSSSIQRQPCGLEGCDDGYVCMKDKSMMGFVHAGFNKARCVKVTSTGAGLCPMPFVHPASGPCSPNCQTDDDCPHEQMCCDIGCGLRCSRVTSPCDNRALPLPMSSNCHIEETKGPLGNICRIFNLYCVENENRTVMKPMPTLREILNKPPNPDWECSSNGNCSGGQICTQTRSGQSHCILVHESGTALCPITAKTDGQICETPNCTTEGDGKCNGDQMCCDVGCGSPKCVRSLEICQGHFPLPNPLADTDKCYYKMTVTTRGFPQRTPCAILQETCPPQKKPPEVSKVHLYSTTPSHKQKGGVYCEGDTCPDPLVCIEMVKQHRENGTKHRQPTCVKANVNRTKLCPNLRKEDQCKSDCVTDADCTTGEMCCDLGCGSRCSGLQAVCGHRILRKPMADRMCYYEEVLPEKEGCRDVRMICKRPPWRSKLPNSRKISHRGSSPSKNLTTTQIPTLVSMEKCMEKGCARTDPQPSVCIDDKVTGQVQCVRVDAVGAGMCPIIPPTNSCTTEIKNLECTADDQCLTDQLCCPVACGFTKCISPQPACDAKPIKNKSPNCYFERTPIQGRLACHNLRLICHNDFDPSTAVKNGYVLQKERATS